MTTLTPLVEKIRAKLPAELRSTHLGRAEIERLKRRIQPHSSLALTLLGDRIEVSLVKLRFDVDGYDVIPGRPIPIGSEELCRHPERAGAVLATALETAGWREKRCAVAVPAAWVLAASTDLPAVEPDDLRGYLELRAEREFPVALSELRLGYSPYTLADGARRATLAALPVRRVDAIDTMLAAAGSRRALSISLALGDVLAVASADPAPALHFLASAGHTDVVVTAGGGVAALRSLAGPVAEAEEPGGGSSLSAEAPGAPFDPLAFARDLRITLGRLPQSISQALHHARFAGDREATGNLRREIRDGLWKMGIETLPEEEKGKTPRSGIHEEETEAEQATAVDAAALRLRRAFVPFEFVVFQPHKLEAIYRRYNTQLYRKIAATVAACIFIPALLFFIRGQYEDHLNSEWNGMRENVADLDGLQQKIRHLRPWFDATPVNVATLEKLFGMFPEAGDVWAKSIQVNGGVITCTGFARSQGALLEFTRKLADKKSGFVGVALKNQRGENPIQFTVTCQGGPS